MTLGFCLMAGTYWLIARGNMDLAEKTQVVSHAGAVDPKAADKVYETEEAHE
jgi:hypothetical protein